MAEGLDQQTQRRGLERASEKSEEATSTRGRINKVDSVKRIEAIGARREGYGCTRGSGGEAEGGREWDGRLRLELREMFKSI